MQIKLYTAIACSYSNKLLHRACFTNNSRYSVFSSAGNFELIGCRAVVPPMQKTCNLQHTKMWGSSLTFQLLLKISNIRYQIFLQIYMVHVLLNFSSESFINTTTTFIVQWSTQCNFQDYRFFNFLKVNVFTQVDNYFELKLKDRKTMFRFIRLIMQNKNILDVNCLTLKSERVIRYYSCLSRYQSNDDNHDTFQ